MTAHTLLLTQGYQPLKVISWQRAITLLTLGKVEIVENYDTEVRSQDAEQHFQGSTGRGQGGVEYDL